MSSVSSTLSPESVPAIQTIFWDLGGVLLTNGWGTRQRAHTLAPLGVDLADFEARYPAANYLWERGLSTAEEFFNATLFQPDQPSRSFTFEQLWPRVCAESQALDPATYSLLSSLKASGRYKLATLNNESRELNEYRLDTFDLRRHFDYFVCSGYVHEMKPHPDIYRAALEISGLPASTAVFIDDKAENCHAAASFGVRPIQFHSASQLRDELAALGVEFELEPELQPAL